MDGKRRGGLRAGDRMPACAFPAAPDGGPRGLRRVGRDALVLLLLPGAGEGWEAYVRDLAAAADEIEYWYARVVVAVGAGLAAATRLRSGTGDRLEVLADAEGALHSMIGIDPARGALLIADRYGEIYEVVDAVGAEGLPGFGEIEEWVKFLATQCPECGVLDQSGHGEWAVG